MRHYIISFFIVCSFIIPFNVGAHEENIIEMSDTGFSPKTLTIEQGETVVFKNVSAKDGHWPASNIHPTHAIYSAFDPLRSIEPGEEWQFTFDKAGSWRMHDHVHPEFTGTITVKANPNIATTTQQSPVKHFFSSAWNWFISFFKKGPTKPKAGSLEPLEPKNAKNLNLESANLISLAANEVELDTYIKAFGPKVLMQELIKDSGGGSLIDCHQEAHKIGRSAYTVYGAAVFSLPDAASCHSGFYHGAMEAFLAEKGTDNLAQNIEAICKQFPTSFGNFECLHGVGHGVMAYTDYDLIEALKTCDTLSDSYTQQSCYGGVFMENVVAGQGSGGLPDHKTTWVSKDPHFPCNAIGTDFNKRYNCYQMQTSWMLTLFDYDFKKVSKECLNASADMRQSCFLSLGRDAAGNSLRDPVKMTETCSSVPSQYYGDCMTGGLNVIVDFWGGGLQGQASEFCKLVPTNHKNSCYLKLSARLTDITTSKEVRSTICNTFEPEYQALCKN